MRRSNESVPKGKGHGIDTTHGGHNSSISSRDHVKIRELGAKTLEAMKNEDPAIGGGYTSSSEIPSVENSAYSKLPEADRALVNKQIDRVLRDAQQEKDRPGTAPYASSVAKALAASEKNCSDKSYVENYVNTSRDSFAKDAQSIANLQQNEAAAQQQQVVGVGKAR